MGTRGHLGGLAEATLQALLLLDAGGKEYVFVETVGTGQSEVEVIGVADTVLLVLMPGSGDSIQALKAGIMEIPDVIAVNKMDHPAAKTMVADVQSILALDHGRPWQPPIVLPRPCGETASRSLWGTSKTSGVSRSGRFARGAPPPPSGSGGVRRCVGTRRLHLERTVREDAELLQLLEAVERREVDPLRAVSEILERVFGIDDGRSGAR